MSLHVVYDLPPERADDLHALYEEYEWWADREVEAVRRALESTDASVALETDDARILAAARVVTDFVYYANVYDVLVTADRRGDGLGQRLMRELQAHPALQDLPGLSLLCREGLAGFYESVGFEVFDDAVEHPEGDPEPLVRMVYRHGE